MTDKKTLSDSAITAETDKTLQVRLKYAFPEPLQAVYANQLVIQHTPEEFLISFYQAFPPANLDGRDLRETLEQAGGVPAQCVARVAITKDRMPAVVDAFVENLRQFRNKQDPSSADSPAKEQMRSDQ